MTDRKLIEMAKKASSDIEKMRAAFGFKRTPSDIGDGGMAFIGFLNFASGDSETAHELQKVYFEDTGKRPMNDMRATPEQVGHYIDWLIETQWGSQP